MSFVIGRIAPGRPLTSLAFPEASRKKKGRYRAFTGRPYLISGDFIKIYLISTRIPAYLGSGIVGKSARSSMEFVCGLTLLDLTNIKGFERVQFS